MTKAPTHQIGDTVRMKTGQRAGTVGVVTDTFRYHSGQRGLIVTADDNGFQIILRGYNREFEAHAPAEPHP